MTPAGPGGRPVRPLRRAAALTPTTALVPALALVVALAGGCGSPGPADQPTGKATGAAPTIATTAPPVATTVDPGTLEQTRDRPSPTGPELDASARLLWDAIVADDPDRALPFFFPKSAYVQVKDPKAVGNDPAGDWDRRLIGAFRREIHDDHRKLGPDAADAQFVRLDIPDRSAAWINPGGEYNRIGYWRVLGSRLVYRTKAGKEQSLPVASLISWRGRWYVVHLAKI